MPKNDHVVGLFVPMNEHVPEGRHVLKCAQMLFRDDAVFMKNLEKVSISLRLAPTLKRYEMIADVNDLLDAQLEVAFDEGPRPDVFFIFLPRNILCVPKRNQIFPQLR